MNISHTFNKIDASDAVKDHAKEKLSKLWPHLTKQVKTHVIYNKVRKHEYSVDIVISCHNKVFQAKAKSTEDFYTSLDLCVGKLMKQLARKKGRLQYHKHSEHSREARLKRMAANLEPRFSEITGVGDAGEEKYAS